MPRKTVTTTRFARHSYPTFYACYLLKSLAKTYKGNETKTNYIGSTPDPPKRIRQHNGEISAGAWKTARRRPWVMQMIVHGFPSRMAALQFEWAWQHPYKARHLKDEDGNALFRKTGRLLRQNIMIARAMLSTHPYNTMALHVKLFTQEAAKFWEEAAHIQLPLGAIVSTELEGVDGKSGLKGSGRSGPIDVHDVHFTSSHLRKNTHLLASSPHLSCFFCSQPLTTYSSQPLDHALCPTDNCTLTAHLSCIADHFLHVSSSDVMIPRGGLCPSCTTHVLWGDVIRGGYRRAAGGAIEPPLSESEDEGEATLDSVTAKKTATKPKTKTKSTPATSARSTKKVTRRGKARSSRSSSEEGEYFNFDGIVSSSGDEDENPPPPPATLPTKKRRGRPPKNPTSSPPLAKKQSMRARASKKASSSLQTLPQSRTFFHDFNTNTNHDTPIIASPKPPAQRFLSLYTSSSSDEQDEWMSEAEFDSLTNGISSLALTQHTTSQDNQDLISIPAANNCPNESNMTIIDISD